MAYSNPDRQRRYCRYWIKLRRKEWFAVNGPCKQCGSGERLELDHIDPTHKVTNSVWSWTAERRSAELAKCQPLCHTCHRAKTIAYLTKPLVHGTDNGYRKRGCRCVECRAGNAKRQGERARRRKAA